MTTDDGTGIHYRVSGRGAPAMVFVHGWCSNLTHWDAQVAHFERMHRVLAIDRRGHGRSDTPAGGFTAKQHALDLARVVERERVAAAVVVGHAGGGPATLAFARAFPALARAVVLVETRINPRTPLGRRGTPERSALGRMIDQLDADDGAEQLAAIYRTFFSAHARPVADRAVAEAVQVPLRVARAELAALAIDSEAVARALTQPVCWLTAAAADEERLSGVFRDVQFGRVVGSGHFPHLEVPDQVNAMIERFVATLPPG